MADSDDERANARTHENQPYDESLEVPDAEEVASVYTPTPRLPQPGRSIRSRGNTPPEARMSEASDDDFDIQQPPERNEATAPKPSSAQRMKPLSDLPKAPARPQNLGSEQFSEDDDEGSDSTSDDDEDDEDDEGAAPLEGAYDPADYEHLPVSSDIKDLFQYIVRAVKMIQDSSPLQFDFVPVMQGVTSKFVSHIRDHGQCGVNFSYTPQAIELETKLKPFIPDFIPAVGDIDAFIKILRPDGKPDEVGFKVLDEPCAKQSDPIVLDLTLRSISKQPNLKSMVIKSIQDADKNPKAIDGWIDNISELHRTKPPPNVHYSKNMPEIDHLMEEWPPEFEELLKEVTLPSAEMDCDLSTYVDMICSILDIPVYKNKVQSLHVLFTLYSEFKNSQHFRTLAEENKMENSLKDDRLVL